jgi:ribosomal protein S18 acetylase RimI-like enzyme
MRPEVRPMMGDDKPAVMQILRNTPEFKPLEVDIAEGLIDCYLEDPVGSGYSVLVAEVNSAVVGYVCYGPTPLTEGTWDIYWIAVAREEQGQGVGGVLLASAEDKIKQSRGRLVIVETSSLPAYEKTWHFYYSQGYELAGRIADFYAPGDDQLTFLKRLQ